jgi:hypothetical protein
MRGQRIGTEMPRSTESNQIRELAERLASLEALVRRSNGDAQGEADQPAQAVNATAAQAASVPNGQPVLQLDLQPVLERLDRIETVQHDLRADISALIRGAGNVNRTFYTTAEVGRILGKAEYTVREWCRLGRLDAVREKIGRGGYGPWRISREELLRHQNEGLRPELRKH